MRRHLPGHAGMESPDSKPTGLYETTCLLGYGMLPMLLHALLCLLAPRYSAYVYCAFLIDNQGLPGFMQLLVNDAGMHVFAVSVVATGPTVCAAEIQASSKLAGSFAAC